MTDHANELRRHADKIGRPAGDTPAVMRQAAAHIEDLERRLLAMDAALSRQTNAAEEIARQLIDTEESAALESAIQKACGELPEGWHVIISLENGAGYPELYNPDGDEVAWHYDDESIADTVLAMLEYAKNQPARGED